MLDPDIQALAETIGKLRAALIRCGVNGPFVLQMPATREGFHLADRLKSMPPHPIYEPSYVNSNKIEPYYLAGVLAGMELRFYEPTRKP